LSRLSLIDRIVTNFKDVLEFCIRHLIIFNFKLLFSADFNGLDFCNLRLRLFSNDFESVRYNVCNILIYPTSVLVPTKLIVFLVEYIMFILCYALICVRLYFKIPVFPYLSIFRVILITHNIFAISNAIYSNFDYWFV